MFASKSSDDTSVTAATTTAGETMIGRTVTVEGNIRCDDNVVVEGSLIGTLHTSKMITIGADASIEGNIEAVDITVAGTVRGNVIASGHVTLQASAHMYGDVATSTITVERGAVIHGRCESGPEPTTKLKSATATVSPDTLTSN